MMTGGLFGRRQSLLFAVHLIGLHERADEVYEELVQAGVDVLYDDRWDSGAGEKFADADLIGIPVRLVVSSKTHSASSGQAGEQVEWKKEIVVRRSCLQLMRSLKG